jgi:hypothetical protein
MGTTTTRLATLARQLARYTGSSPAQALIRGKNRGAAALLPLTMRQGSQ